MGNQFKSQLLQL
jgi:Dullard-like phosphatase family protein